MSSYLSRVPSNNRAESAMARVGLLSSLTGSTSGALLLIAHFEIQGPSVEAPVKIEMRVIVDVGVVSDKVASRRLRAVRRA